MKPYILIAEDEAPQAEILRYNLEAEGYRTAVASDGRQALDLIAEEAPDLLVLDWMLPEVSGVEVCRAIRRQKDTRTIPVIMLTARGGEDDRVRGLDSGADDYMVKPYSPRELISRIRAVLRRAHPAAVGERLEFSDLVIDMEERRVTRNGNSVKLGPTEFRLLVALMERPRRVLSREILLDMAWGHGVYVETRTVDVHIRRLRKALNAHGRPDLVRTVRGAGYALDDKDR